MNVTLVPTDKLATVTGTVTDKDGNPESGVQISVTRTSSGANALHRYVTSSGKPRLGLSGKPYILTDDDGTYEASVLVEDDDEDYTITPKKKRMYFDDPDEVESLETGDTEDGVDFEALDQSRIRGYVQNSGGGGMPGLTVMATGDDGYIGRDDTDDQGSFSIWVDGGDQYYDHQNREP